MEVAVGQQRGENLIKQNPDMEEYREAVKKLINAEVKNVLDDEIKKAAQELIDEQKKAVRQVLDEHKAVIQQIMEEERKSIWEKAESLRKSILKSGT